jgi:hypothetical protein
LNARLTAAARTHAKAMAEQNFFGHAGKDGSRFSGRIKRQGYSYRAAAENIAAGHFGRRAGGAGLAEKRGPPAEHAGLPDEGDRDRGGLPGRTTGRSGQLGYPLRYYWVQVFATPG